MLPRPGEYLADGNDLMLGTIEGCPFFIDARIYRSWDDAELILDVAPGDPEGFTGVGPASTSCSGPARVRCRGPDRAGPAP